MLDSTPPLYAATLSMANKADRCPAEDGRGGGLENDSWLSPRESEVAQKSWFRGPPGGRDRVPECVGRGGRWGDVLIGAGGGGLGHAANRFSIDRVN